MYGFYRILLVSAAIQIPRRRWWRYPEIPNGDEQIRVCEICNKGFQRDQNLQLHRRGHNLPWKLKQRNNKEVIKKKVYVCPEPSCVHHDPSRALGDLTGIKNTSRENMERKNGNVKNAQNVMLFNLIGKLIPRFVVLVSIVVIVVPFFQYTVWRDSFITHRAFCDALAEESSRSMTQNPIFLSSQTPPNNIHHPLIPVLKQETQNFNLLPPWLSSAEAPGAGAPTNHPLFNSPRVEQSIHQDPTNPNNNNNNNNNNNIPTTFSISTPSPPSLMSKTALLQKAAQMGVTMSTNKMPYHHQTTSSDLSRPHHHHNHVGAPGFCATSSTINTAGLPSREENIMGTGFMHGLASFGDKGNASVTSGCMQLQGNMNMVSSSLTSTSCGFDGSLAF
ncbi:hypothetical protein DH2020_001801 [Rehmannia glutinosa]|uniref:C2H2-type domain-containing protein n=1 Tax=Rehmannia glutinosa TaxID=99300 RepID=A0ABR0XSE8_REHGL